MQSKCAQKALKLTILILIYFQGWAPSRDSSGKANIGNTPLEICTPQCLFTSHSLSYCTIYSKHLQCSTIPTKMDTVKWFRKQLTAYLKKYSFYWKRIPVKDPKAAECVDFKNKEHFQTTESHLTFGTSNFV